MCARISYNLSLRFYSKTLTVLECSSQSPCGLIPSPCTRRLELLVQVRSVVTSADRCFDSNQPHLGCCLPVQHRVVGEKSASLGSNHRPRVYRRLTIPQAQSERYTNSEASELRIIPKCGRGQSHRWIFFFLTVEGVHSTQRVLLSWKLLATRSSLAVLKEHPSYSENHTTDGGTAPSQRRSAQW